MTTNEEQEYKIFKVLVTHNIAGFSLNALPAELKSILGDGAYKISQNMARDGFLVEELLDNTNYRFTSAGLSRYAILKKKKRNENVTTFVGWATLILAGISAWYAYAQYHKPG